MGRGGIADGTGSPLGNPGGGLGKGGSPGNPAPSGAPPPSTPTLAGVGGFEGADAGGGDDDSLVPAVGSVDGSTVASAGGSGGMSIGSSFLEHPKRRNAINHASCRGSRVMLGKVSTRAPDDVSSAPDGPLLQTVRRLMAVLGGPMPPRSLRLTKPNR